MSLVRLLEMGRSLNAIKDTQSRYRMQRQHLLPKFGLADSATTLHAMTAIVSSSSAGLSHRLGNSVPHGIGNEVAAQFRWQRIRQALVKPFGQVTSLVSKTLRLPQGLGVKFGVALRVKAIGHRMPVNHNLKPEKAECQPELSLDNVTVIRNDLSDADLQVVQVQDASKASMVSHIPSPAVSTGPVSAAWEAVKTRLHQVPVGYQGESGFHRGVIPAKREIGWSPFW